MANGYKIVARGSGAAEIYLYGPIGGNYFGDGITAKQVADDLKKAGKVSNIDVRINSEGGDVFDGKAIYTLLNEHPGTVTIKIDGIAASAASVIAMAGDTIEIAEGAMIMVHDAYGAQIGRAEDMRTYANLLDTVNATIRDVYRARTKKSDKEIAAWMSAETWFTSQESLENGFVDKVNGNMKIAASLHDPSRFKNLPPALLPNRVAAAAAIAKMKAPLR